MRLKLATSSLSGLPSPSDAARLARGRHGASRPVLASSTAQVTVAVAIGSIVLGAAVATSPRYTIAACAALVVGFALLKRPPIGVVAVLMVSAILGDSGAHVLVMGVPLLELLLVLASLTAVARIVAVPGVYVRTATLVWVVPALWGFLEFATRNRGNVVSGAREALIFIYPLLFALPLVSTRSVAIRRWLYQYGPYLCLAGWVVLGIGVYNHLAGHETLTTSGQLRALGSWYAEPLVAAAFVSLWLYQNRRISMPVSLLLAAPVCGLLLVNSRSAYLGVVIAGCALAAMRATRTTRRDNLRRLGGLVAVAACLVTLVVVATPAGQSGLARFSSITSRSDPDIQDRLARTRSALPTTTKAWLIGDGVGLTPTNLAGDTRTMGAVADPNQTHNSFATMLHLGGVVGLLVLMVPVAVVLRRGLARRTDPLVQILIALVLFTLVVAAFNVVLENAYFGVWLWLPVLVLQALVSDESLRTAPGSS
jgi:hypothetical protein